MCAIWIFIQFQWQLVISIANQQQKKSRIENIFLLNKELKKLFLHVKLHNY